MSQAAVSKAPSSRDVFAGPIRPSHVRMGLGAAISAAMPLRAEPWVPRMKRGMTAVVLAEAAR